jgi:mevalonate kinase
MTTLQAPSKNFIIGEYAVLQYGCALIHTSTPHFSIKFDGSRDNHILPDSPAGQLLTGISAHFIDPYDGAGGMGASTAQFLLAYSHLHKNFSDKALLESYWQYAWDGKGMKPSGADLLAQRHGGLCYIDTIRTQHKIHDWPFKELDIKFIRTGKKLATHEHLHTLTTLNTHQLQSIFTQAIHAIEAQQASQFVDCINAYADELSQLNLCATHTQNLLKEIRQQPDILAAKGCGAMGADTILTLSKKQ